MKMVYLMTGMLEDLPTRLGNIHNPSPEQCLAYGYRYPQLAEIPEPLCGYERIGGIRYVDGTDGIHAIATYNDTLIQDRLDAEKANAKARSDAIKAKAEAKAQARLDSFLPLVPTAQLYRSILQSHFGEGAETNPEVTTAVVIGYFMQKRYDNTLTTQDTFDSIALDKLHTILMAWNHTDETYTLPWELVP